MTKILHLAQQAWAKDHNAVAEFLCTINTLLFNHHQLPDNYGHHRHENVAPIYAIVELWLLAHRAQNAAFAHELLTSATTHKMLEAVGNPPNSSQYRPRITPRQRCADLAECLLSKVLCCDDVHLLEHACVSLQELQSLHRMPMAKVNEVGAHLACHQACTWAQLWPTLKPYIKKSPFWLHTFFVQACLYDNMEIVECMLRDKIVSPNMAACAVLHGAKYFARHRAQNYFTPPPAQLYGRIFHQLMDLFSIDDFFVHGNWPRLKRKGESAKGRIRWQCGDHDPMEVLWETPRFDVDKFEIGPPQSEKERLQQMCSNDILGDDYSDYAKWFDFLTLLEKHPPHAVKKFIKTSLLQEDAVMLEYIAKNCLTDLSSSAHNVNPHTLSVLKKCTRVMHRKTYPHIHIWHERLLLRHHTTASRSAVKSAKSSKI